MNLTKNNVEKAQVNQKSSIFKQNKDNFYGEKGDCDSQGSRF